MDFVHPQYGHPRLGVRRLSEAFQALDEGRLTFFGVGSLGFRCFRYGRGGTAQTWGIDSPKACYMFDIPQFILGVDSFDHVISGGDISFATNNLLDWV